MSIVEITGKQVGSDLAVCFNAIGKDVPLHLCVVVDVSGSMRENDKLKTVQLTLMEMVKMLDSSDRLSLISFSNQGFVHLNSTTIVDNATVIETAIRNLVPISMTNMEAGMKLISTLTSVPDAIFLLTDGILNAGATSCTQLMEYIPEHLPIFAVGYGSDHNQILLQKMALRSNGMYSIAAAVLDVPDIVGVVLGSLRTMVVRYSELKIPDGWTINEINNFDNARMYSVGHIVAGSNRWVCLKHSSMPTKPALLELIWTDATGTKHTTCKSADILVDGTDEFVEQIDRCRAAHAFANMYMPLLSAKYTDVLVILNKLLDDLTSSKAVARPTNVALLSHIDSLILYVNAMLKRISASESPTHSTVVAPYLMSVVKPVVPVVHGIDPRIEVVSAAIGTAVVTLCIQHGSIAPLDKAKVNSVTASPTAEVVATAKNWLYSTVAQRTASDRLTISVTASVPNA